MNIHLQGFIFVDRYGHIYVADKIYKKSEYKKDNAMLYAIIGVEESLNGKIIPSVFSQKKRLPKMKNKPVENDWSKEDDDIFFRNNFGIINF